MLPSSQLNPDVVTHLGIIPELKNPQTRTQADKNTTMYKYSFAVCAV